MEVVRSLSRHDVHELRQLACKYNLCGIEVLNRYSDEELACIYNGVGPDRFPEKLRSVLTEKNTVILPAVLIHDIDYYIGGGISDFYNANSRLGKNSRTCINAALPKFSFTRILYLAKVSIFVKLCNVYGKTGWNFKDQE